MPRREFDDNPSVEKRQEGPNRDDIVDIFRKHFGKEIVVDPLIISFIQHVASEARNRRAALKATPVDASKFSIRMAKVQSCLEQLDVALPEFLAACEDFCSDRFLSTEFRAWVADLRQLQALMARVLEPMPERPKRKPDTRAHFHDNACWIAKYVESTLTENGIELRSRISDKSPLVKAVADILEAAGVSVTADRLRKILQQKFSADTEA